MYHDTEELREIVYTYNGCGHWYIMNGISSYLTSRLNNTIFHTVRISQRRTKDYEGSISFISNLCMSHQVEFKEATGLVVKIITTSRNTSVLLNFPLNKESLDSRLMGIFLNINEETEKKEEEYENIYEEEALYSRHFKRYGNANEDVIAKETNKDKSINIIDKVLYSIILILITLFILIFLFYLISSYESFIK